MTPGMPLRSGEPLFQIDPVPYRLEVQRLEAAIEVSSRSTSQLEQKVKAAVEAVVQTKSNIQRITSELKLAELEASRAQELIKTNVISRQRYDQIMQNAESYRDSLLRHKLQKVRLKRRNGMYAWDWKTRLMA